MPAPPILTPEQEKALWDKRELNMDTSKGLSRAVIFYLIKCFAVWQGRELRQLETSHVTFGKDDLGLYVAIDFESIPMKQKRKMTKRYDDPANPRSVYKIFKKYRGYVANEGPFLVRPITSIQDFICYSPLPLGLNVTSGTVFTLMKDAGLDYTYYGNSSLNMQAVDILVRFGTGSHCLAPWFFGNGLKGMPTAPECGPINCEDANPEISLMISRLLDAPYPVDAVEIIQKIELEQQEKEYKNSDVNFHSWITNINSAHKGKRNKETSSKEAKKKGVTASATSTAKNNSNKRESISIVPLNQKTTGISQCSDTSFSAKLRLAKSSFGSSTNSTVKGDEQDNDLRITSVSSISESAFAAQVDEAGDEKKDSPCAENRKRTISSQSQPHPSPPKRFRQDESDTKSNSTDSGRLFSGRNTTALELERDLKKSDSLNSDVNQDEIREDCFIVKDIKGSVLSCEKANNTNTHETLLLEVKEENGDSVEEIMDDGLHLDEVCDDRSGSALYSSHRKAPKSEKAKDESPLVPKLSVSQLPCDIHHNLKSTISVRVDEEGETIPTLSKSRTTNHDSIFVLREMRCHSVKINRASLAVSSGGDADTSKSCDSSKNSVIPCENDSQTPSQSNLLCQMKSSPSSSPSSWIDNESCRVVIKSEDENSKDKKEDFAIDLSPPVLSPQIPVTCYEYEKSDDDLLELEERNRKTDDTTNLNIVPTSNSNRGAVASASASSRLTPTSSSSPSSSSSSSSTSANLISFLDNAHQHIENLLQFHSSSLTNNDHNKAEKSKVKAKKYEEKCIKNSTKPNDHNSCLTFLNEKSESIRSSQQNRQLNKTLHIGSLTSASSCPTNSTTHSTFPVIHDAVRHLCTASSTSTSRTLSLSNSQSMKGKCKSKSKTTTSSQKPQHHSLLRSVLENPSTVEDSIPPVPVPIISSHSSPTTSPVSSSSSSSPPALPIFSVLLTSTHCTSPLSCTSTTLSSPLLPRFSRLLTPTTHHTAPISSVSCTTSLSSQRHNDTSSLASLSTHNTSPKMPKLKHQVTATQSSTTTISHNIPIGVGFKPSTSSSSSHKDKTKPSPPSHCGSLCVSHCLEKVRDSGSDSHDANKSLFCTPCKSKQMPDISVRLMLDTSYSKPLLNQSLPLTSSLPPSKASSSAAAVASVAMTSTPLPSFSLLELPSSKALTSSSLTAISTTSSPLTSFLELSPSNASSSSSKTMISSSSSSSQMTSSLSSSPPPPTITTTSTTITSTNPNNTATFTATHDNSANTLFRTLEVATRHEEPNHTEKDVQTYNFADIPISETTRSTANAEEKNPNSHTTTNVPNSNFNTKNVTTDVDTDTTTNTTTHDNRAVCIDLKNQRISEFDTSKKIPRGLETSAFNVGDYFPPGTLIPASSIRIVTQQGETGSEVIVKFGFTQQNSK